MKKLIFILTIPFIFDSCNKNDKPTPNQISYSQQYYIWWLMNDESTSIASRLLSSENDYKKVSVNDQSVISINGLKFTPAKTEPYVDLVGTNFFGLVGADFILYKSDGNNIKNTVNANEINYAAFASNVPKVISKQKGFSFEWVGQLPIENDERISLILSSCVDSGIDFSVFYDNSNVGNKVVILPEAISGFPNGEVIIELQRGGKLKDLPNRDNNIPATVAFYSIDKKKVQIID